MDPRLIASAAFSSLLALGLATPAAAQDGGKEKEKCYGVAKAGTNDCANISESHSCAGQSKVSDGIDEWIYVAKGTCVKIGGKSYEEALALVEKKG